MNYLRNVAIIQHITTRISRNKNALMVITGGTGSGKSYAALRLGEKIAAEMGHKFKVDNVIFDIPKFMEQKKTAKPGTVFIFDEFGVTMGARDWQSGKNKVMSYVLQTFRFENYICIFTVPRLNFIDKHARELMHYWVETQSIDYKKELAKLKVYLLNVDPFSNDMYRKFVQIYDKENATVKGCPYLKLKMPSKGLITAYEKKKTEFLNSNKAGEWSDILRGKKDDKPKPKKWAAKCDKCNYEYEALVPNPKKCPSCSARKRLVVAPAPI